MSEAADDVETSASKVVHNSFWRSALISSPSSIVPHSSLSARRAIDSFSRVIANLMLGHRTLHTLQDFFGLGQVQSQFLRR
jgi:hypothetical protein